MRKSGKILLRKVTGIILCLISTIALSQNIKMQPNRNQIEYEFKESEKINSEFNEIKNENGKIQIMAEIENDSLFSIYIKNNSKDILNISTQDGSLKLIQEAKDKNGNWKPIEYWSYSWCGNSYSSEKLEGGKVIKTESNKYFGKFKTEIRFKLLENNNAFYSNSIICNINLSKFKIPKDLKNHYTYKNVVKVADEKLAEKVMFLEPNAMNEYSEKNKIWIAECNRKRNEEKQSK